MVYLIWSRTLLRANPHGGLSKAPQWLLLKSVALTLTFVPSETSRFHRCHIIFSQNAYSLLFFLIPCCTQQSGYIWWTNKNSARMHHEILLTFVSLNYFLHQFSPFPNCHTAQHGRLFHPEWKPGIWPGPVAHIRDFCKVCHHAGCSWSLEGRPSVCLVSVTYFLARIWPRNSHSYQTEKNRATLNCYHMSNDTVCGKWFFLEIRTVKTKLKKQPSNSFPYILWLTPVL